MNLAGVTRKQLNQICSTFLFDGMKNSEILSILKDERAICTDYGKGEVIFRPQQYSRSLAYILKGAVSVSMQTGTRENFPMRKIEAGSFFGVAAMFNDDTPYVTEITAVKETRIIFFSEALVEQCIREHEVFAMNYVRFLSDRIRFLNRKINLLANSSSENSLIGYLLNAAGRFGEEFRLEVSYTELARNLNIGRSSLYRAMDDLEEKNIIRRKGRNIILVNYDALKKY
ncbi:MAG: Crp/Fnr family transcriptional regulator [Erysipelotrichaceae bacterium]|nr:Crp/Fnr family transcriptional regulator [Erysipelotrichaceae bacterium]